MINAMNYSGRGNSSGEKCTRNKGERAEEKGGEKKRKELRKKKLHTAKEKQKG